MIGSIVKYTFLFILLAVMEIFVVSRFNIHFYVNPHIYLLFIIILPVFTNRLLIIFLGFLLGFTIDQFLGTGGLHAAATVTMAYLRSILLSAFAPREGYGKEDFLTIGKFGLVNFLFYCGFMILIHHFFLFFLELFTFRNFLFTLIRTLSSSLLSLLFIVGIHFLFSRRAAK